MLRRLIIPLIFGLAGAAVLVGLGTWQVQRLAWKQAVLADIEARIAAAPVALPASVDPVADRFLPVEATGVIGPGGLRVLVSQKQVGAGYRIISPFAVDGRMVLLDRGFIALEDALPAPEGVEVRVTGNLHWPDEVDGYTPAPDVAKNIWFARDVPAMAAALGTEPVMIVVRTTSEADPAVTPLPVSGAGIPNDHLEYAITWFSLAAIWLAMTGFFIARTRASAKADMT